MNKTSRALALAAILASVPSWTYAEQSAPKPGYEHGAPPPCCATGAKAAESYQASGVVKKIDAAKGTATIAHGPVQALNWPAMTMAFKVKEKALLDKMAVNKKIDFTLAQDGKEYVITAVR